MDYIRDADERWEPEEGDELKGHVTAIGFDQETDIKSVNVNPIDETHVVRVGPLEGKLGRAWKQANAEVGDKLKITRHEDVELMRPAGAEEAETVERYSIEEID